MRKVILIFFVLIIGTLPLVSSVIVYDETENQWNYYNLSGGSNFISPENATDEDWNTASLLKKQV